MSGVSTEVLVVDEPSPGVRRLTMNRPEKHNALNNALRAAIIREVEAADSDPAIKVTILRGAGRSFCSGYDLAGDNTIDQPYFTAGGAGHWPRHVVDGWFRIWDCGKPVIAQVHGYCLAGGSELATCCDLVYVADDAEIGYPPVRLMSPPDNQFHPWLMGMRKAMEMMLTGDSISGKEAVEHGFANRSYPAGDLDKRTIQIAERIALIPSELVQINKRAIHRAMEVMGLRTAIRYGTELQALAYTTASSLEYRKQFKRDGSSVSKLFKQRDQKFEDLSDGKD
jgi:enoyl-CoA hydratase